MRSFDDLQEHVLGRNLCHRCGGCVTFCTAINYGALELKGDGYPGYKDKEKCIDCGICYTLCPEVNELDPEIKKIAGWSEPAGRIISTNVVRARDSEVLERATDGGAVTSILLHLLNTGRIDGAIVSKYVGLFNREPYLATTKEEILNSCGSFFDASHGMVLYSQHYSTYSPSIQALSAVRKAGSGRVAFVGTPCQIVTMRKMQALGVVPTDSIYCYLGLFCSGNFAFDDNSRKRLEKIGDFKWNDVRKINIKGKMYVYLNNGVIHTMALDELDFIKRHACRYCDDYTAEYADLSFGGIGADEGWTTVLTRTQLGMEILNNAERSVLERFSFKKPELEREDEKIRNQIRGLQKRIKHHKYIQYGMQEPSLPDPVYDSLVKELGELEKLPLAEHRKDLAEQPSFTAKALNKIIEKSTEKRRSCQIRHQELGQVAVG
jgi:coenzyme F420 hydrogenase subunit beta